MVVAGEVFVVVAGRVDGVARVVRTDVGGIVGSVHDGLADLVGVDAGVFVEIPASPIHKVARKVNSKHNVEAMRLGRTIVQDFSLFEYFGDGVEVGGAPDVAFHLWAVLQLGEPNVLLVPQPAFCCLQFRE